MRTTDQDALRKQWRGIILWHRLIQGVKSLSQISGAICFVLYLIAAFVLWKCRYKIVVFAHYRVYSFLLETITDCAFVVGLLILLLLMLLVLGMPRGSLHAARCFSRIGLVTYAGESPILLSRYKDKKNPGIICMEFFAIGIPLQTWEKNSKQIEAALNLNLARIVPGKDKYHYILYTVPGTASLPSVLMWKEAFLSKEDFVIKLGEGLLGQVSVNLRIVPHVLLGGSTGSGKSVLLKLIIMQCIKKGAVVYIADFKGGVDFSKKWRTCSTLITEETDLQKVLDHIVHELERRKQLFAQRAYDDICTHNQQETIKLRRIVFACDEVAEILDKTGRDKAGKERIAAYESRLATIARLGRAFGIHLILSTQRPDANILAGQIRNNMDCRICGRADNVLSQIILDNTAASDEIPKDAQGRFITPDGTVFQGYLFNEDSLLHR